MSNEKPPYAERPLQILAIIAAIIALPAAIVQGRPTSTVTVAALLLAAIAYLNYYIWRASDSFGHAKFGRQWRWIVSFATLMLLALTALVLVTPQTGKPVRRALLNARDWANFNGFSIANSPAKYRIRGAIRSSDPKLHSIKKVHLDVLAESNINIGCAADTYHYSLKDRLSVGLGGVVQSSEFAIKSGKLKGFSYPAQGNLRTHCMTTALHLSFSPGITLEKAGAIDILVDLPKKISANHLEIDKFAGAKVEKSGRMRAEVSLVDPTASGGEGAWLLIVLTVQNELGKEIHSCGLLRGSEVTLGMVEYRVRGGLDFEKC